MKVYLSLGKLAHLLIEIFTYNNQLRNNLAVQKTSYNLKHGEMYCICTVNSHATIKKKNHA